MLLIARALILAVCLGFLGEGTRAATPDLAGDWYGEWVKNSDSLPVAISFSVAPPQGFTGILNSDALQVAGIPVGHITCIDGRVHFELQGDEGSTVFDGVIRGDKLSGTFIDHEHHDAVGHFDLARSSRPIPVTRTREVVFENRVVSLAGTVLLPSTPGRHPAVVFLQGSGPEGRWANRYLAQRFAEAGIASLIYDKRGVGHSTGDWRGAGFDALAEDGAAGVRLLRDQPEVDPARVGVYGHSQGGTITPLVSERAGGLGFIIAAAAAGLEAAVVETYSVENAVGLHKLAPADRAEAETYVREVVKVAYDGKDRRVLDEMAETLKPRPWFFAPPPPDASYWAISRQIADFHPGEAWRRVKEPVLLVYGGKDQRVPPLESIRAIQAALQVGGGAAPSVQFYSQADHIFTVVDPSQPVGWPKRVPGYADALILWIKSLP